MKSSYYYEGGLARLNGRRQDDNPYGSIEVIQGKDWNNGWVDTARQLEPMESETKARLVAARNEHAKQLLEQEHATKKHTDTDTNRN